MSFELEFFILTFSHAFLPTVTIAISLKLKHFYTLSWHCSIIHKCLLTRIYFNACFIYIYIYIYIYLYMLSWKQYVLPIITTMALWQLMHFGYTLLVPTNQRVLNMLSKEHNISGHKWSTTHRVLKSHRSKMCITYMLSRKQCALPNIYANRYINSIVLEHVYLFS